MTLKISQKMGMVLWILILALVILMAVSKWALVVTESRFKKLLEEETAIGVETNFAKIAILESRINQKDLLYFDDATLADDSRKAIERLHDQAEKMGSIAIRMNEQELMSQTKEIWDLVVSYQDQFEKVLKAAIGRDRMIAGVLLKKIVNTLDEKLNNFQKSVKDRSQKETIKAHQYTFWVANVLMGLGLVAMAFAGTLSTLFSRAIVRSVIAAQRSISQIEQSGDLTKRVQIQYEDEVGKMAGSFNDLMRAMQSSIQLILKSVSNVHDAAEQLSVASNQVAQRSAVQNQETTTMAASLEEITSSIQRVSNSANQALELSKKSGEWSEQGGGIIEKTTQEMLSMSDSVRRASLIIQDLGQKSNEISSVVGVIQEVANQTNLLALNAAIEAARAGEQGRGFAVVADEVRKLAERTRQSTEEITHMIETIQESAQGAVHAMAEAVKQVERDMSLAKEAGSAIQQIKQGALEVISVVTDISSALAEQSAASSGIANQVAQLAEMNEQNTSAVQKTAQSAIGLAQLADDMKNAVSQFQVE